MHHSRLKLNVQAPLKLKDLTYKFVVHNKSTNKQTIFEGRFDEQGFTQWYEIHNINTVLIYEVYIRESYCKKFLPKPIQQKVIGVLLA